MDVSAPIFSDDLFDASAPLTAEVRARRARQRRHMLDLIGLSYVFDAALLLLFAYAGTLSANVGPALAACGLTLTAIFIALSESRFNDRFDDHHLVVPQAVIHSILLLTFAALFPQVGLLFLCSLFIVCSFSAISSSRRQALIVWSIMAFGIAAVFELVDGPMSLPHTTALERFTTTLMLVTALGRCMYLGTLSAALRDRLYKRSIELKQAYQVIEELAELDELTGAFNRRCIMRVLEDEIAHARHTSSPLSIALIDLDWFKRINDVYGHPAGDEVLKTFAITIFANIRAIDRFGRYGGEEFLLILPATPKEAAALLLERLRAIVADLDWSAFSEGMLVTLSAGVAALHHDEPPEVLLARADSALYEAKALGRNRVALSSLATTEPATPSNFLLPQVQVAS